MENQYAVGWGTLALINAGLAQGKKQVRAELVFTITFTWAVSNYHIIIRGKEMNL